MTKMMRRRTAMAGTLVAPLLARHGWAQSAYPGKQIRMVVPFAAAGTTDLLGRIVAQYLTELPSREVLRERFQLALAATRARLAA